VPESEVRVSQMDRSRAKRFRVIGMARVLLASMLLAVCVAGIVPMASVAAGSTCQLECCAGRSRHAAGSCMNGSCEAVLATARAHHHHARLVQAEKLCGLPKTLKSTSLARTRVQTSLPKSPDTVTAAAFERPCPTDCGGCASGFTNSNRQRNSATLGDSHRPRPPTDFRLYLSVYRGTRILAAKSRQGAPRGPPFSVS
jgi:hypothetical protein